MNIWVVFGCSLVFSFIFYFVLRFFVFSLLDRTQILSGKMKADNLRFAPAFAKLMKKATRNAWEGAMLKKIKEDAENPGTITDEFCIQCPSYYYWKRCTGLQMDSFGNVLGTPVPGCTGVKEF